MRTSVIVVALLVSAGQASASSCEGPRPWKSPDAVQYSDTDLRLFYDLAIQTRLAYSDGDKAKAKRVAQEYLSAASRFTCDWNYGNAVHDANAVLGLIALQEGHREAAVRHLLAAGLRISVIVDAQNRLIVDGRCSRRSGARGRLASTVLNVSQSSTISLKWPGRGDELAWSRRSDRHGFEGPCRAAGGRISRFAQRWPPPPASTECP